jgi:transcription initiation factor IIE alpha subunit
MKKITIAAVLMLAFGIAFTSCNETKKTEAQEEVQKEVVESDEKNAEATEHDHSSEMAMATYQCPMKCEGDKTYDKQGSCPKCNMDLKKVEVEESNDSEKTEEPKEEKQEDQ